MTVQPSEIFSDIMELEIADGFEGPSYGLRLHA
jgi:hypothetical protein